MFRLSWIFLVCCLLIVSCASTDSSVSNSQLSSNSSLGQQLPIKAKAEMGGEIIELEVAETPEQQAIGLMYRQNLPKNRGMVFPMNPPRVPRFWMKNVEIPLDMIFVREGIIQAIAHDVPPCEEDPCPTYTPKVLIDQVIELRGGRAKELGLEIGDSVSVEYQ